MDDLDWSAVREHPLSHGEVRFLTYMMNIESHTIVYLRDLLSTRVIEEPDVTAFLSCWAYEEFFHGYYLERFLKAYCGDDAIANDVGARLDAGGRAAAKVKVALGRVVSHVSPDFAAVHMTWGAAQEFTTLHGYEALSRQSEHPILKELLARIVKDERRHFAFYQKQAAMRLARSEFTRRETRFLMDRVWRPVGANEMPASEFDFIAWYLFRDAAGAEAVRNVDATIAKLPGMAGWRGLEREVAPAVLRQAARGDDAAERAYERRAPRALPARAIHAP